VTQACPATAETFTFLSGVLWHPATPRAKGATECTNNLYMHPVGWFASPPESDGAGQLRMGTRLASNTLANCSCVSIKTSSTRGAKWEGFVRPSPLVIILKAAS